MAADRGSGFSPATLDYLRELALNNERGWFRENQARYESTVLGPALAFIEAMQRPLGDFAPHFVAAPQRVGGSLMRVYRDTRFSRDKEPYKTNIGIQFRHEAGKDVHAPGYYVHIAPDESFVGAGMWRPDSGPLRAVRERIAERPAEWRRATGEAAFRRHFHLGGERLTRPPRGFDASLECIDDVKRTSFIAIKNFDPDSCLNRRFLKQVETAFRAASAYMRFLCKAVDVPF
jgi:uncharacterized protein (TIGR02453 family)